jgi:hypothetical protein
VVKSSPALRSVRSQVRYVPGEYDGSDQTNPASFRFAASRCMKELRKAPPAQRRIHERSRHPEARNADVDPLFMAPASRDEPGSPEDAHRETARLFRAEAQPSADVLVARTAMEGGVVVRVIRSEHADLDV